MKLKLVYIMRRTVGGMQTHLIDLISRLDRSDFEVFVVAPPSQQLENKLKDLEINFIPVDIEDRLRPLRDLRSILKLRRILRKMKPHLLHIHGNKSALVGRFAAMLAGHSIVIIVTVHNYLIYQEAGWFMRVVAAYIERFLTKRTNIIITVSDGLKKSLVSVEHIPEGKIVTIPNGIAVSSWGEFKPDISFKKNLGFPENAFVIGTIGRLVSWKGHSVLLEALPDIFKKHPHTRAVIVGDGPLREELEEKARKLKIEEKVLFLGFVSDVKPALSVFDVFVLPSLKEPFGIVLLEAMAARCPIVATRAGGVPEIIENRRTGLLVPAGDIHALANAVDEISSQPDLGKKLVKKAYEVVSENFSIDNMVKKTVEVYHSCVNERGGA